MLPLRLVSTITISARLFTIVTALAGYVETRTAWAFQGMAAPKRSLTSSAKTPPTWNLPRVPVDFRDVATQAELTAITVSGGEDTKKYILEATGTGVVIFDYDNDGLPDIFLVNARTFDTPKTEPEPTSHLYRNLGQLKFEDVTKSAGLDRAGWGQGACAADYDNDGLRDLYVTYYGQSVLYRNSGKGRFDDVSQSANLRSNEIRWDTGCSFLDYDLDGDLDLVVSGYVEFDRTKIPEPGSSNTCRWKGLPVMCGPLGLPPGRNHLFRNDGSGKFTDVSMASGIGKPTRCYGFTAIASDLDSDGYPDVYVACDSTPSLLYHNLKNGTFEEIGIVSGAALNEDGQEQAGMGVAIADFDNDGDFDIAKSNFSEDVPNLYRNDGANAFIDTSTTSGLAVNTAYLGWGIQFLDVDHDGREDLLIVNGHVYPEVDHAKVSQAYRQPRLLYWNAGGGKFRDISRDSGAGISESWSSRGAAVGDLDNNGTLEVVISNLGARPSLLKNFAPTKNWLMVRCVGDGGNRDGIGARVRVIAGEHRLSREVHTGNSFVSQNDVRLHFGLGDSRRYDKIEVTWPGLKPVVEVFPPGDANRIVVLRKGAGKVATGSSTAQ